MHPFTIIIVGPTIVQSILLKIQCSVLTVFYEGTLDCKPMISRWDDSLNFETTCAI